MDVSVHFIFIQQSKDFVCQKLLEYETCHFLLYHKKVLHVSYIYPRLLSSVLNVVTFFSSPQEPDGGQQNPRNAGDPGGAVEQDRGRAGQHQRRDEGGRQASHRYGEVVRPLRLPVEQVSYPSS
jgi:hypothetical protein